MELNNNCECIDGYFYSEESLKCESKKKKKNIII
jgi:hypothetical protein